MKTTRDVIAETGINRRTLEGWVVAGFIPRPSVRNILGRRGRQGIWPDSVVPRVRRLLGMQAEGMALKDAVRQLEAERVIATLNAPADVLDKPLSRVTVNVRGKRVPLADVVYSTIIATTRGLALPPASLRAWFDACRAVKVLDASCHLLRDGYNPVALFDGSRVEVVADVLVSHALALGDGPWLVIPLTAPLHECLTRLGMPPPPSPRVRPGFMLRVQDGDVAVEMPFAWIGDEIERVETMARVVEEP